MEGEERFSSSKQRLRNTPMSYRRVPIAPSNRTTRSSRSSAKSRAIRASPFRPGSADLLEHADHHPTVLRAALGRAVVGHRLALAVRDDVQRVKRQPLLIEVVADGRGAALSELEIVLLAPDVVGVSVD